MVLLIMTDAIVNALKDIQAQSDLVSPRADETEKEAQDSNIERPMLEPVIGNPISHDQVIDISRRLKAQGRSSYHLDIILRGSRVFIPPPPPKPESTSEYKRLMARLRREEESRAYERMINPPPPQETFHQRFPSASAAYAFSSTAAYGPINSSTEEDGITYTDVNRQITLILNVLVSVAACGAAIWMAARWWDTPARLALSMSGSLVVGIAEVVVYSGYIRRLGDAKQKEGAVREVKEVVKTWVIGGGDDEAEQQDLDSNTLVGKKHESNLRERRVRKGSSG